MLHRFDVSVMPKRAKGKGRGDAKNAGCAGLSWWLVWWLWRKTQPLVVAQIYSYCRKGNFQALVCTAHKIIEYGSVRKRDA